MRNQATARLLGLLVGLLLGVVASYVQSSSASRNSSGTYSLPSGNPVISGTTITSANENSFRSDVATELTNSLDRSGRGSMSGALQCSSGTAAAPGLTFSGDTDTGLYRIGANNIAIATAGAKLHEFNSTQSLPPSGTVSLPGLAFNADPDTGLYRIGANNLGIAASGTKIVDVATTGVTFPLGVTATQSTANTTAFTATGNGTAAGLVATGGATSGNGATLTGGAPNGAGLAATGTGTGTGLTGTGGATGSGVTGVAGGSPTADTNTRWALVASSGHVRLNGGNPAVTTGFSNTLTPMNVPKAWARITTDGATGITLAGGFNVSSVSIDGSGDVLVNFTTAFSSSTYVCLPGNGDSGHDWILSANNVSSSQTKVIAYGDTGAHVNQSINVSILSVVCFGAN